ncbi:hypothetical protein LDZ95_19545 [Pseudomonas aeruginosa]|uniref:Uncharacterized protein n=2 Tax=Pseudomonas aeruginosa TaxID=287 RepID=A0A9P1R8I0_PSEAI|nr:MULTISPECIES: hypothetical protein [Pseudomonas]SCZ07208.1 Uncharacterised protein [Acinetobacter baumannii]MCA4044584.1 hypothetical protein [Pseudomonas aeruginosa]MCG0452523.1 hypothetical protein [Pseudomonas aeruginosa]MCL8052065.1 hypothetical protein [Pseudomonas aeruginosa]MCL9916449.1 hypothetical protein [Pseudomonas aeruginosa]
MTESVTFPKGDLRRMLVVLAAIDSTPDATLVKVVARTGLAKKTVTDLIAQAGSQAMVKISKQGPVYAIEDWGPLLKKAGVRQLLKGAAAT